MVTIWNWNPKEEPKPADKCRCNFVRNINTQEIFYYTGKEKTVKLDFDVAGAVLLLVQEVALLERKSDEFNRERQAHIEETIILEKRCKALADEVERLAYKDAPAPPASTEISALAWIALTERAKKIWAS